MCFMASDNMLRSESRALLVERAVLRCGNGMRRLMQVGAVKRSRVNARDGLSVQQLEDFAAACRDIKFWPPLSDKQAALQPERTMLPGV